MRAMRGGHPDDEMLESYLLGSLPRREVRLIEEHLLTCHDCVESAKRAEAYIQAMRAGLNQRKRKPPVVINARHG